MLHAPIKPLNACGGRRAIATSAVATFSLWMTCMTPRMSSVDAEAEIECRRRLASMSTKNARLLLVTLRASDPENSSTPSPTVAKTKPIASTSSASRMFRHVCVSPTSSSRSSAAPTRLADMQRIAACDRWIPMGIPNLIERPTIRPAKSKYDALEPARRGCTCVASPSHAKNRSGSEKSSCEKKRHDSDRPTLNRIRQTDL